MIKIKPELAHLDQIGEAFHTALRKAGDSEHAHVAWRAISKMDGDEWASIVSFVQEGLRADADKVRAAAPELLEALKMLRGQYVLFVGPDDDIADAVLQQVDAAIAAAEEE